MLEIRYKTDTKEVTGWWGNRFGNEEVKLKNRPDEAMAMLDIPIPDKSLEAWLFDSDKLIPNPDYVEPETPKPVRDLAAEIDELKAKTFPVFTPPAGTGIPEKVECIEQYLKELQKS